MKEIYCLLYQTLSQCSLGIPGMYVGDDIVWDKCNHITLCGSTPIAKASLDMHACAEPAAADFFIVINWS